MKKYFMISIVIMSIFLHTSLAMAFDVFTDGAWKKEQMVLPRLRRQFSAIGAGAIIDTGGVNASPVISGNFAFLHADLYPINGGSLYLGGRVIKGPRTEVTPFAIGVTLWYGDPLWAKQFNRLYDISFKIGFTVRTIRFIDLSIYVKSSMPDPASLIDGGIEDVEDFFDCEIGSVDCAGESGVSIPDVIIAAVMPKIVISIRSVYDLKKNRR